MSGGIGIMAREAIKPHGVAFQSVHAIGMVIKRVLTNRLVTRGQNSLPWGDGVSWVRAHAMLAQDIDVWDGCPSRENLTQMLATGTALLVRYDMEGV